MDANVVMLILVIAVAAMGGYVVLQNKKKEKAQPAAPATPDPIVAYTPPVPTPPNAVVVDALTPQQILANMGGHDPKFDYTKVETETAVETPAPVAAPIVVPIVAMPPPTASVAEQKAAIDLLRQQIAAFKKANGLS